MLPRILQQKSTFLISKNPLLYSHNIYFSTNYPYKFGGLRQAKKFKHSEQVLKQGFGNQIFDNFREAYKTTLQALAQKDTDFLRQILQPNLMRNLQFKQVQLVGDNNLKSIDIITGKMMIILGSGFLRSSHKNLKTYFSKQQQPIDMIFDQDSILSPNSFSLSLLLSFNIFFKGHMKLIKKNDNTKNNQIIRDLPQIHSLQFQVEAKRSKFQLLQIMGQIGKIRKDSNQYLTLFLNFLGKDYEWKIADIDNVLNRNITV